MVKVFKHSSYRLLSSVILMLALVWANGGSGIALAAPMASTQITLTNGGFEQITTFVCCTSLYQAAGWINLSAPSLQLQAASALQGFELTNTGFGTRYLRLADDQGILIPQNIGHIAQDLGVMIAGERYTLTGVAFQTNTSHSTINPYQASISFVTAVTIAVPALASTSVNITALGGSANFSVSYTATSADNGQHLYLRLDALPQPSGKVTRGGIDNLQLNVSSSDALAPEIDVKGNNVSIVSGDSTPSATDHTDFGSVSVSIGTVVRTFTIQNTGNGALSVSTPAISGAKLVTSPSAAHPPPA